MLLTTFYEIGLNYLSEDSSVSWRESGEGGGRLTSDMSLGILNSLNRIVWMKDLKRLSFSSSGVVGGDDVDSVGWT